MTIDDIIEKMEELGIEVECINDRKYVCGSNSYQIIRLNKDLMLVVYFGKEIDDLIFELMSKNNNRKETEEPYRTLRWPSSQFIDVDCMSNLYEVNTNSSVNLPFQKDRFFMLLTVIKRMLDV